MTQVKEAFLSELEGKPKQKVAEYSALYVKYTELAIKEEENKGSSEPQAKAMGSYYAITVLSDFLKNDHLISRIIEFTENTPR